jgi:hypothetical protein
MYSVYALINPRNKKYFYVGITGKPLKERLGQHIQRSGLSANPVNLAIASMDDQGLSPQIVLLQTCSSEREARSAEKDWISSLYKQGHGLVNYQKTENPLVAWYENIKRNGDPRGRLLSLRKDRWIESKTRKTALDVSLMPDLSFAERNILDSLPMPCLVPSGIIKEMASKGMLKLEKRDGSLWAIPVDS